MIAFLKRHKLFFIITTIIFIIVIFILINQYANRELKIVALTPSDNAQNVSLFPDILVEFNKPLTQELFNGTIIQTDPPLPLQKSLLPNQKILKATFEQPLQTNQKITITLIVNAKNYTWSFTTTGSDKLSIEDQLKAQTLSDKNFALEDQKRTTKYPWLGQLPLHTDTYFVFFDLEKEKFIAALYLKSDQNQQEIQNIIQTELMNISPDTQKYPIEWTVNKR